MGPNFGLSALDCHPPQVKGQLKALAHYREQLVQIEERHRQRLKGPPSLRSAKTNLAGSAPSQRPSQRPSQIQSIAQSQTQARPAAQAAPPVSQDAMLPCANLYATPGVSSEAKSGATSGATPGAGLTEKVRTQPSRHPSERRCEIPFGTSTRSSRGSSTLFSPFSSRADALRYARIQKLRAGSQ